jgi:hypothetical protein
MSDAELLQGAGEVVRATAEGRRAEKADLRQTASENDDLDAAGAVHGATVAVWELLRFRGTSLLAWLTGTLDRQTLQEVEDGLREKIRQIPQKRRQQPKPNVAVPALEALAYSWDEATLREMYLNLIQRSADSETAESVHPSFVDIVRHLSAAEAEVLDAILRVEQWAAVRLSARAPDNRRFRRLVPVVLDVVDEETREPAVFPHFPLWVTNWERLGLVELDWSSFKEGPDHTDGYAYLGTRPEWLAVQQPFPDGVLPDGESAEGWTPDFDRGILRATALGLEFRRVVSVTPPPQAAPWSFRR